MPEHQQIHHSKKPDNIFQKKSTPIKQIPLSNPMAIIQRVKINPKSLTHADVMQLQRTIGNRAVGKLLSEIGLIPSTAKLVQRQEIPEEETCPSCVQRQDIPKEEEPIQGKMSETIQRQEIPEEEEPLQGKMINPIQRQEIPEEEQPLQGRMAETIQCQEIPEEEEPLQGKMIDTIQRQEIPEEEEPLQGKMIEAIQRQEIPEEEEPRQTKMENNTGMPDNLKTGVENLSGIDMSDVRVHYNSDKPAEVGALAYTQGTDIHVAPGQEKHLPHEAWHVVQQAQSRVKPMVQLKEGFQANDDKGLEHEADMMGVRAMQMKEVMHDSRPSSKSQAKEQKTPSTTVFSCEIQGNESLHAKQQSYSESPIQAKLTIGRPDDKYEQEADQVASKAVKQINALASTQSPQGQSVQRREEPEEELRMKRDISAISQSSYSPELQRETVAVEKDHQTQPILQLREAIAGGEASTDLASAIDSARGGGQPLETGLKQSMGWAMGADFSEVRVHKDGHSDELNQSIQAKAFTTGQDVFFRQGTYEPGSREGQELIAHELIHVVQQSGGGRSLMARKNRQISNTELRLQAAFENKGISHIVKADSISVMKEEDQGDKLTNDKLSRGDIYELVEHLVGNPEKNLISEVKTEDAKRVHILKTDCGDDKWSKVDIPKLADMTYPPIALHKKGKGGKRPPKAAMESAQVETKRTGLKRPPFELEDVPPSGDVRDFSGSKESTGQVRVEELKELRLRGALVPYQETPLSIGAASTKRITTFCTYCLEWFPSESLDSDHIITSELLGKQLLELNKKLAEYPKLIDVFIIDFTNRGISWQLFFMQNTAKQWVVTQRGWELIFQNLKNLVFACKRCNQVERNDTETVEFLEKMLFFGDTFVRYMEAQKPEWKEDLKQSRMPGLTEYILNYVQSQQHTMAAIEAFKKKFELDMEVVQRVRKYARKMSPEESEAAKKEGAGGMLKVKLMQDAAATVMEQAKTPGRGGEEWNQGDAEELIESLAFQASRLGSVEPYNQLYQEVEFLRMQHDMDVDKIHELQKSEEEKGKLLAEKIEESKRLLAELEKFKQSAPVPPK